MNRAKSAKSVLLIRHGESEANVGGTTTDYDTIQLSPRGHEQACDIASGFDKSPNWIGLSAYRRARQTAQPLLDEFPNVAVHELAVHEFTYLAASRCVNMNAASRQPLVDEYWSRMSPEYCDGDGAESFSQFSNGQLIFSIGRKSSQDMASCSLTSNS